MKKKTVKKLVLAKETVRSLGEELLGEVKGASGISCLSRCYEPDHIYTRTCGC